MKFLILNAGSSTVKLQIIDMPSEQVLLKGTFKNYSGKTFQMDIETGDQPSKTMFIEKENFENPLKFLQNSEYKDLLNGISKVAHRIVHGGEEFKTPAKLDAYTIKRIEQYNDFAPLHNPIALEKVKQIENLIPNVEQYAVFDTSFNLTIAKEDYLYGLPYEYYENFKIRRYGFHGISHEYIAREVEGIITSGSFADSRAEVNDYTLISCHLGSGSSVCAVKNGKAVYNSFGFSTNENLIMATRSGEVDFDAIKYLKKKLNLDDNAVDDVLNTQSGLLGISRYTKDMKELLRDYTTNEQAKLAVDMYVGKVIEQIYVAFSKLQNLDYIVFTGGIGAGSDVIRKMILDKLAVLNINYFHIANDGKVDVTQSISITHPESDTAAWVIPTNEELHMARVVSS